MSANEFPIPEANIQGCIKLLIEKEGLEQLSSSKIRAHLKSVFDHDFSTCKKMVDNLTQSIIESMRNTHHDSSSDDEQVLSKAPQKPKPISPDVITKASSSHESDDSDSDPGVCSATVPRKRSAKRTADTDLDTLSGYPSRRRACSRKAQPKIKRRSVQVVQLDANGKKIDKYTTKTKLVYVSEQLQQLTGHQFMRNCDIVAAFWAHVKSNNLLDEKKKQFVCSDELLAGLTKKKRFKSFSFMREVSRHIQYRNEMEPEIGEQCDEELRKRVANYLVECKNAIDAVDAASSAQKEEKEENSESVENTETDKNDEDLSDSD